MADKSTRKKASKQSGARPKPKAKADAVKANLSGPVAVAEKPSADSIHDRTEGTAKAPAADPHAVDAPAAESNAGERVLESIKRPAASDATYASQCRRKRALVDEIKSEYTTPARSAEIRLAIDAIPEIPILSHTELERLGN